MKQSQATMIIGGSVIVGRKYATYEVKKESTISDFVDVEDVDPDSPEGGPIETPVALRHINTKRNCRLEHFREKQDMSRPGM